MGDIVRGFPLGDPQVEATLERYAETIRGWAAATGARMLADVSRRDEAVWARLGKDMGRTLRAEVREAPTGATLRRLLEEQVHYITSLPLDAARRVHELTLEGIAGGRRADDVAREILRSGEVTQSRATLIARTEVARTSSALVQARAEHVGSEGYIWRTAEDSDVRELHRKLNGKFVRWDDPPVAGSHGERAHAGMIYNCRCWSDPVIPEE